MEWFGDNLVMIFVDDVAGSGGANYLHGISQLLDCLTQVIHSRDDL